MVIHTISSHDDLASRLATRIIEALPPHKTGVLLLSGGSCIPLEVTLSQKLPDMKNLHVILSDERFGAVGHTDSNWEQLSSAGFGFNRFTSHPTLLDNLSVETTVSTTRSTLHSLLEQSDFTLAIFGMGMDGHTAGLLPHSSALQSTDLYTSYQTEQYHRTTITPTVFGLIDYAILYTEGDDKRAVLETLESKGTIEDQPVRLIEQCRQFDSYNLKKEF